MSFMRILEKFLGINRCGEVSWMRKFTQLLMNNEVISENIRNYEYT